MKNSKIRLPYKLCLLIASLFSLLIIHFQVEHSVYQEGPITLIATILSYQIDGDQLKIEGKAKEKLEILYYFSSKEERDEWEKRLQFGAQINIQGKLQRPSNPSNFYLFSYRNYLRSKKIHYQLLAEQVEFQRTASFFPYQVKNDLWKRMEQNSSRAFLKLFLFGDQSEVEPSLLEQYQQCGISHLMVISGMHVSFLLTFFLFFLGSPKKLGSYLFLASFLLFYAFLTGFTPSILRACLFFILINGASLLKLQASTLEWFLLLTSCFLFYNPYYWYHVGFLFSFLITGTLLWMGKGESKQYWKKTLRTSFIAFVIALPIVINQFSDVNFLSPLYNLFFVPFVSFLIFPLALFTLIVPLFTPVFQFFVMLLNTTSAFLSTIPSIFSFRTLSPIETAMAFLLLFWMLSAFKHQSIARLLFLPLVLLLHYYTLIFVPREKLVMFDVGQGDAILLQYQNHAVLMDTGGLIKFEKEAWRKKKKEYSLTKSILVPYLKAVGVHSLDALMLSHGDFDHAGEALNLLKTFPVHQVFFNQGENNQLEETIQSYLVAHQIPFRALGRECFQIAKQPFCSWNEGMFQNENDNSLIVDTKRNGVHILLMGDASIKSEQKMLAYFNEVVDIVKIGHHGSKTSTSEEFLNTIRPRIALLSVGTNNRYGHPHTSTIKKLNDHQITYYQTSRDGMVELDLKKPIRVKTCFPGTLMQ